MKRVGKVHAAKKRPSLGTRRKPASNTPLLFAPRPAAESTQERRDFLAMVSHELRAPLAPMLLWVRALRTGGMSEALRTRAVEALESCINAQTRMIDDLIDVARGQRGDLRLELQRLELQTIVNASVQAHAPAVAARKIRLTVDAAPEPVWVMGDSTRLGQVVSNLLSNSLEFTQEGGNISLSLHARDAEAVLVLRDDGEGLEGTRLTDLFEPPSPESAAATTRRWSGRGLWLTIVRQLVAQHGGTIAAERARARRGVCFKVTLPLHTG
jgi:signal transduction histidine kinase